MLLNVEAVVQPQAVPVHGGGCIAAVGSFRTWIEPAGQEGGKRVRFSELSDAGWTAPSTIAEGAAIIANWVDVPSAVRQSERVVVAHWSEGVANRAEASDVFVARSSDAGVTWQRLGPLNRDHTATEHGWMFRSWITGTQSLAGLQRPVIVPSCSSEVSLAEEKSVESCRSRLLADPVRLRIYEALRDAPASPHELALRFGLKPRTRR